MPRVELRYSEIAPDRVRKILGELPALVADALRCKEGGPLSADEIEVRPRRIHRDDVGSRSISITILANEYPSRKRSLKQRAKKIADGVKPMLPPDTSLQGSVWILLAPGAYVEF